MEVARPRNPPAHHIAAATAGGQHHQPGALLPAATGARQGAAHGVPKAHALRFGPSLDQPKPCCAFTLSTHASRQIYSNDNIL
eukprot:scaffold115320_cov42-Prasinocladus_malaysianus.AAC.1